MKTGNDFVLGIFSSHSFLFAGLVSNTWNQYCWTSYYGQIFCSSSYERYINFILMIKHWAHLCQLMHGWLTCITFHLYVARPKLLGKIHILGTVCLSVTWNLMLAISVTMARTSLKVTGQGYEVKKCDCQAFGWGLPHTTTNSSDLESKQTDRQDCFYYINCWCGW